MASDFSFVFSSNNSGNISIETANTLASADNAETAGSIAFMTSDYNDGVNGFDAFGGKDIFGNPDCSSMNETYFANANARDAETAGSLACVGNPISSVSVFTGSDGGAYAGAGASVGGDCGGGASCGGGGFTSVC